MKFSQTPGDSHLSMLSALNGFGTSLKSTTKCVLCKRILLENLEALLDQSGDKTMNNKTIIFMLKE